MKKWLIIILSFCILLMGQNISVKAADIEFGEQSEIDDNFEFTVSLFDSKLFFTWNVVDTEALYTVEYSIIPTAGFLEETMYEVIPLEERKMCYSTSALPYRQNWQLYFRLKIRKSYSDAYPTYSEVYEFNWPKHKVTFMNGDTVVNEQYVYEGEDAYAPILTKEGYELSWEGIYTNVATDITIRAVWTQKSVTENEVQTPQKPETTEQSNQTTTEMSDTEMPQSTLPEVGTKYTVSNGIYKVTKSSATNKEVTFLRSKSGKETSFTIPATIKIDRQTYKVTEIASKAFKNNKKLKSVIIGKDVNKIGKEAFLGCKKLKKITVKSTVLRSIGKNAIKSIDKRATIKVPKKKLSKYKKLFKGKTGYKKTMKIKK